MYRCYIYSQRAVCWGVARRRRRCREEPKRAPLTTAALDEWIRDVGEDKSEKIKCPAVEKGVE